MRMFVVRVGRLRAQVTSSSPPYFHTIILIHDKSTPHVFGPRLHVSATRLDSLEAAADLGLECGRLLEAVGARLVVHHGLHDLRAAAQHHRHAPRTLMHNSPKNATQPSKYGSSSLRQNRTCS